MHAKAPSYFIGAHSLFLAFCPGAEFWLRIGNHCVHDNG